MTEKYSVDLTGEERERLVGLTTTGTLGARRMKRALLLLAADDGKTDREIRAILGLGRSTVFRIRRKFVEGGVEHALADAHRQGGTRKLAPDQEATLVALACSEPPAGRSRWTLQLLAARLVAMTDLDSVSSETVRRRLLEKELKPWQKRMWCIPAVDSEFVARMEDLLDLYAEEPDPKRPVVCFDETPVHLVGEVRKPIPGKPGRPMRYDYEYSRHGQATAFVYFDAARRWRHVEVATGNNKAAFAQRMRELAEDHYPDASLIRVVLDNLSTHTERALYESFAPERARSILRRLRFHYTPKHGSWLNMVELEIGVMSKQCLDRRIAEVDTLAAEVRTWAQERNASGATIKWLFRVEDARAKFARSYPDVSEPL